MLERYAVDAIREKEKRILEEETKERDAKKEVFKKLLEKQGHVKASTTWKKIQDKFIGYKEFEDLERVDALDVFSEMSKAAEKTEEEKQEREKQGQMRIERQNRDVFRFLLK